MKEIFQDPLTKNLTVTGLLALVFAIVFIVIFWGRSPSQVPLFYSKPWGQDQLANVYLLPLPIVLAMVFLASNIALFLFLVKEDSFVQKILVIGGNICLVLSAITVIRIALLVS